MNAQFKKLDDEVAMVERLGEHGHRIFTGDKTTDARRALIRSVILDGGLEFTIYGRTAKGKTETYAQAFERTYNEPFESKSGGRKSYV